MDHFRPHRQVKVLLHYLSKVIIFLIFCISFSLNYKYWNVQTMNHSELHAKVNKSQKTEGDLYGVPKWLPECRHIYMDLGSNIGVQIKKLFEPEKYPIIKDTQARVMELYTQEFGKPGLRKKNNSRLCALGFEPNPKHYQRLKYLERTYNDKGWNVHFFPFVVSNKDEPVTFYTEDNSRKEDWGATLFKLPNKPQKTKNTIQAISLSNFIKIHLSPDTTDQNGHRGLRV